MAVVTKNVTAQILLSLCNFISTLGCPHDCFNRGECKQIQNNWKCICNTGFTGEDCNKVKERVCSDHLDNDLG